MLDQKHTAEDLLYLPVPNKPIYKHGVYSLIVFKRTKEGKNIEENKERNYTFLGRVKKQQRYVHFWVNDIRI